MSETVKIILWVLLGIAIAAVLFCLIVVIGCSVNGLTFGEQVCAWFSPKSPTPAPTPEEAENVAQAIARALF